MAGFIIGDGDCTLSIINISYLTLSAIFFAACAIAQLNDPDPFLWVIDYIFCGCILNLLHAANPLDAYHFSVVNNRLIPAGLVVNCAAICKIFINLWPKIDDMSLPYKQLAWSILKYEEGREISGLILLVLHIIKLRGYYLHTSSSNSTKKNSGIGSSNNIGTLVVLAVIAGAVYLWIYYQPQMNARYKMEHCDGAFGTDRSSGSEL